MPVFILPDPKDAVQLKHLRATGMRVIPYITGRRNHDSDGVHDKITETTAGDDLLSLWTPIRRSYHQTKFTAAYSQRANSQLVWRDYHLSEQCF